MIIFSRINFLCRLEPFESFMALISIATQPKNIFLYILPVFVAFSPRFYVKIMIAALSANYVTIVLKWFVYNVYYCEVKLYVQIRFTA